MRPHWKHFLSSHGPLHAAEMAERWEGARRLLRQNGVTYNIYGDPQGIERPWPLDLLPLLLPNDEWRRIETGVAQRASLLNTILADLYGPQTLIRSGRLPASLIYADPGFRRQCHGLPVPNNRYIHFYAVDLVRGAEGNWWVLADRTSTPSGAGYALENRAVTSQVLPETYRHCHVERLAPFFAQFRESLLKLAPEREPPRVVVLTPGPYTETYFEHAYLARHLGITLVEGEDLTVRDRRVFLKTLSGLEPVDVILRRLDEDFCDPLELRADSSLGVAGLLQAVRAGTVVVANALGSGLMESTSFKSFLPSLCRHLLGEELQLPSVASWWCGQEGELSYVLDNLDRLVIKGANRSVTLDPIFGSALDAAARDAVRHSIRSRPWDYVGQEKIALSTAPVWRHNGLQAHHVVLRVYAAAAGLGYAVMPGGLTRVAQTPGRLVVSMHSGGGSKDTWVLDTSSQGGLAQGGGIHEGGAAASREAGQRDPRTSNDSVRPLEARMMGSDLPSRVADGLFWLGRYAERCDSGVRLLRGTVSRLIEGDVPGAGEELTPLLRLLVWHGMLPPDLNSADASARELLPAIRAAIFNADHPTSLRANVQRMYRAAYSVRDRLSRDMWRVMTRIDRDTNHATDAGEGASLLEPLDETVTSLTALFGLEQESMVRGPGWRFLTIGRRLERAAQMVAIMRGLRADDCRGACANATLEVMLELAESFMTYRGRYFATMQRIPVLQLLLVDSDNPRALAFQLATLRKRLHELSESARATNATYAPTIAALSIVESASEALTHPQLLHHPTQLRTTLDTLAANLPEVSNLLAHAFFSHAFARSA